MEHRPSETWPNGRHVEAFAPGAPRPGEAYEACVFDGTWTRARVLDQPVCWPCYREYGAIVGPAIRSRQQRLAEGRAADALHAGGI